MTTHGDDPPGAPPSPNAPTRLDATASPPPADHGPLSLSTTFAGRYHVKCRIGTGGMVAVYQA